MKGTTVRTFRFTRLGFNFRLGSHGSVFSSRESYKPEILNLVWTEVRTITVRLIVDAVQASVSKIRIPKDLPIQPIIDARGLVKAFSPLPKPSGARSVWSIWLKRLILAWTVNQWAQRGLRGVEGGPRCNMRRIPSPFFCCSVFLG